MTRLGLKVTFVSPEQYPSASFHYKNHRKLKLRHMIDRIMNMPQEMENDGTT